MGIEFDFVSIGEGKNGDAICVRYEMEGEYIVGIIDCAKKDCGAKMVEHIREFYKTETIDFVINTHPDIDHVSGLTVIFEEFTVKNLIMHKPWEHAGEIFEYVKDGRITEISLIERMKSAYKYAYEVHELAIEQDTNIVEPFQGDDIGVFKVLSPSYEFYIDNLISSEKTPEIKKTALSESMQFMKSIVSMISAVWSKDNLKEDVSTSAENENSVITYSSIDEYCTLLTGDAGIKALDNAINYATYLGIDLKKCELQQIPHHGGRHNVSSSILDRLIR